MGGILGSCAPWFQRSLRDLSFNGRCATLVSTQPAAASFKFQRELRSLVSSQPSAASSIVLAGGRCVSYFQRGPRPLTFNGDCVPLVSTQPAAASFKFQRELRSLVSSQPSAASSIVLARREVRLLLSTGAVRRGNQHGALAVMGDLSSYPFCSEPSPSVSDLR